MGSPLLTRMTRTLSETVLFIRACTSQARAAASRNKHSQLEPLRGSRPSRRGAAKNSRGPRSGEDEDQGPTGFDKRARHFSRALDEPLDTQTPPCARAGTRLKPNVDTLELVPFQEKDPAMFAWSDSMKGWRVRFRHSSC
jgi:hypothetical protein